MFSEKDLQQLLEYSAEGKVLSVYLNTNPSQINTEAAKLWLRNALKPVDLPEDVQAVENFVNLEYDWLGKGVAIFSNQKENYFNTFQFNLSLPNEVDVNERPVIRPLVHLLDTFMGWGVVLVDRQQARIFSFDLGELTERDLFEGDEIKQLKRGGGTAVLGQRGGGDISAKIGSIIDRNIKEMIDSAVNFFEQHRIRRIMLGGTDDNIARFRDALPKSWQSLIVGSFPMSMAATQTEVLEQATKEALATQDHVNRLLIEQSITLSAKGNHGVTGLIDTLNMIHEGRVRTLLVMHDFEQTGFRCDGCGYLTVQELHKCPFCGGSFKRIDRAVEMAVEETLRKNAEVKVIHDSEALTGAGRITAILRY
ncbi:MAG: hypothetical protein ACOX7C_04510 [Brevefilum sp.]|jgi:hypothetical protein